MKRVSSVLASLLVLAALLAPAASAAPGELDPSFATAGSERFFFSNEEVLLRAVAVQPDGKIVLAGTDFISKSIVVVRLAPNGAFDQSFGGGGVVLTPLPGGIGGINAAAVQPDGKIVVAGQGKVGADSDFLAVRYDAGGGLDPSFGGGDGIEVVPLAGTNDRAEAIAIGKNERILLSGEARQPSPSSGVAAAVAVLQTNGVPDPSFSTDGLAFVQTTGAEKSDQGAGIAEQADGKIVFADETGNGAGNGFTIVRLLASGEPDPQFGTGGVAKTPIPGAVNAKGRSTDVVVQPDGRIVASGYGYDEIGPKNEIDSKFAAVRYLSDGKPDPSFGGAGTGIFSFQVAFGSDAAQRIAITPTGKLILAGPYALSSSTDSPALLRLDPAGIPDPGFGIGGIALRGPTAPFGNSFEDAALDSRERVVVTSLDYIGDGNTEVEVSRFLGDVPPDPPTTPAAPAQSTPPRPVAQPPHARLNKVKRKLEVTKLTGFSGTAAAAAGGTVARVQVAVVKATSAKAGRPPTCQQLQNAKGRFKVVKAVRGNCPLLWMNASGTAKWSFKLKTVLPPGRYVVYSRALDAAGLAEESFSRAAGNRFGFRLLAPPEPLIRNP